MSNYFIDLKPISRVRRNHGLEHATLHVLNKKFPEKRLAGISSPFGFTIVGEVSTEDVAEAAVEALKRLRAGEEKLALHPNCGTNFAVPGIAAGLFAWLGTLGPKKDFKSQLERLPLVMILATIGLIIFSPLGPVVQKKISTSGKPGTLELERVETSVRAGVRLHRVVTKG
jgi:hypothetical protein